MNARRSTWAGPSDYRGHGSNGHLVSLRLYQYSRAEAAKLFRIGSPGFSPRNAKVIHETRVASRRLQVSLEFMGGLFPLAELERVRSKLKRWRRCLGKIRTIDVNIALLRQQARHLKPSAASAIDGVIERAMRQRRRREREVNRTMETMEFRRFAGRIRRFVGQREANVEANQLAARMSAQLEIGRCELIRRYKRFLKRCGTGSFHKFRIAAKQYRYLLELCQGALALDLQRLIRAVKRLQDCMGRVHDFEVLSKELRQISDPPDQSGNKKKLRKIQRAIEKISARTFREFQRRLRKKSGWKKKIILECIDQFKREGTRRNRRVSIPGLTG